MNRGERSTRRLAWVGLGVAATLLTGVAITQIGWLQASLFRSREITPERLERLAEARFALLLLGTVVGLGSLAVLRWPARIAPLFESLPWNKIAWLIAAWMTLAGLNLALMIGGLAPGTSATFPISVFLGPALRLGGLPWAALFLAAVLAVRRSPPRRLATIWLWGLLFLLLGNLVQGGWQGLSESYAGENRYLQDAWAVDDSFEWLHGFNESQRGLGMHARTHPPFAVLLHGIFPNRAALVAGLTLLASATLLLLAAILEEMGIPERRRWLLVLLLAVTPAFNIYACASLDGVIAAACTVSLLGLVRVLRRGPEPWGLVLVTSGFLLASMLSFASLFLPAVVALCAGAQLRRRRYGATVALAIMVSAGALVVGGLSLGVGYDHLQAFRTATSLENPNGFLALEAPLVYLMTRIEGVCEIVLFLSLGTAALLWERAKKLPRDDSRDPRRLLLAASVLTVLAMLATGAFRNGETARSCLFLFPYLILALPEGESEALSFAAVQCAVMQLLGSYGW